MKYRQFYTDFEFVIQNGMWLSNPMNKKINKLADFLTKKTNINILERTDLDTKKLGFQYFDDFVGFQKDIKTLFFNDFENLYKVKEFFEEKRKL